MIDDVVDVAVAIATRTFQQPVLQRRRTAATRDVTSADVTVCVPAPQCRRGTAGYCRAPGAGQQSQGSARPQQRGNTDR